MPFALLIVGIILVIAAIRNTVTDSGSQKGLTSLVKGDFTGQNNFIYWMVAILVIGALGYIDSLKTFSRAMMVLILVALFLNGKQGSSFFTNFQSALSSLGSGNFSSTLSNLVGGSSSLPSTSSSTSGSLSAEQSLMQEEQSSLQDALNQYSSAASQGIPGTAAKAAAAANALQNF